MERMFVWIFLDLYKIIKIVAELQQRVNLTNCYKQYVEKIQTWRDY